MEQQEEMMILKSDIAIVVKKDGTTLIQDTNVKTFINLFEGIAGWLEKADKRKVAEYCLGELIGHQAIKNVVEKKTAELDGKI